MSATTAYSSPPERAPSVLVVLAVRDAAEWLRECLQALAVQTYPRVGVLAVDDASTDGSNELLVQALGEGRVLRQRTVDAKVPAGVEDGTRIRFTGYGEGGLHGGPPGDLYVHVHDTVRATGKPPAELVA